jgi:prepilin signal peptidase PulO-like enzyme (type II secretory pathway)
MTIRWLFPLVLAVFSTVVSARHGGRVKIPAAVTGLIVAAASFFLTDALAIRNLGGWYLLAAVLFLLSLEDARTHSIPKWYLALFAAAIAADMVLSGKPVLPGLIGAGASFVLFGGLWLVTGGKGIGFGDIAVFCIGAAALHPAETVLMLLLASAGGLVYSLLRLLFIRKPGRIAFLPFISASFLLVSARSYDIAVSLGLESAWATFGLLFR